MKSAGNGLGRNTRRLLAVAVIPLYTRPYSMSPARTAQSMTIGADWFVGVRLQDVAGAHLPLAPYTFDATLTSASGAALATPQIQICDDVTARIFISHTITGTLTAQTATLRLWATRIEDGLRLALLVGRITITI